jgi:hypothetical protein
MGGDGGCWEVLKAVVNLALHEFFERRHYLPQEAPTA